jgi:beta-galactosidase
VRVAVKSTLQVEEGVELPQVDSSEQRLQMLGMGLSMLFTDETFVVLVERMGIDPAGLPGQRKFEKIQSLLGLLVAQNRVFELLTTSKTLLVELNQPVPPELDQVIAAGEMELTPKPVVPASFGVDTTYTVYGSGDILLETEIKPNVEGLPFLPRFGLEMVLASGLEQLNWYGRGPHETYTDRQEGALVGVYSSTVDEQFVPYLVPEENGNKTEVRWVSLTGQDGMGLLAIGAPWFEFNALHYTTQDLDQARHPYELTRLDEVVLHLDYAQSGLGSAACGPGRLEKYQVKAEAMHFSVRLRPFNAGLEAARSLSKQVIG